MTKKRDEAYYEDKYVVKQSDTCLVSAGRLMGYGAGIGTALAFTAAQNFGGNISFVELFGREMGKIAFPAVLLTGVYASTTCIMDEMRGKDKPLSNGFIGGAAAGAVLGTRGHNPGKIASYAVMCGLLGFAARMIGTNGLVRQTEADRFNDLHKQVVITDITHLSAGTK